MLFFNDDAYQQRLKKDRTEPFLEEEEDNRFEFTKGLSAGVDQTQALGGGFLALAGSAFNNDDLFYYGLDVYNRNMEEAAESEAEIGRIEDIELSLIHI